MDKKVRKPTEKEKKILDLYTVKPIVFGLLGILLMAVGVLISEKYMPHISEIETKKAYLPIIFGFLFAGITTFVKGVETWFDYRKLYIETYTPDEPTEPKEKSNFQTDLVEHKTLEYADKQENLNIPLEIEKEKVAVEDIKSKNP